MSRMLKDMYRIEAILFDLDGVLVDACGWHYRALNEALLFYKKPIIEYQEHLKTYNGLPTLKKLNMLGIAEDLANKINDAKQEFTLDIIKKNARLMPEKIELHKFLKQNKIKIGCVTNSIRKTTEEMLKTTEQFEYMDIIICNEDVKQNKPSPDCYNLAIKTLNVNPLNVLCVEDSEKGIMSVTSSIAKHLLIVKNTHEVNVTNIQNKLKEIL